MQNAALKILLLFLLMCSVGDLAAQMPTPSPAEPLFKERPFGPRPPETPPPVRQPKIEEPAREIPFVWVVVIGLVGVAALAGLYYGSIRRWHSSNLFDRQYRFPIVTDPALRFGAKKCGGHLARVEFGPLVRQGNSKAKDA